MSENKLSYLSAIDEKADVLDALSDYIWEHPETAFTETKSAAYYIDLLKKEGFEVRENLAGIKTAFSGSFGHGKPVMGFLGEFDALTGLSQEGGALKKAPLPNVECGHGCGHNFLGTGALGAAIAVKRYLEETKAEGTVVFYGCPAEEGGSGKGFMARDGVFDELSFAITWHPAVQTRILEGSMLANRQVLYKFDGIASHAGGAPEAGRSALDALELMNVGVQFLREHIPDDYRIHYEITDAGGYSPNVVQPHAEVLYLCRTPRNEDLAGFMERVDNIAKGAALMTGTKVTAQFIKAASNYVSNSVLNRTMYECSQEIEVPHPTEEDLAFGRQLALNSKDSAPAMNPDRPYAEKMEPLTGIFTQRHGSSDVGDVSRVCPTIWLSAATWTVGTPSHSWQVTAQGTRTWGKRMTRYAAKLMAATAVRMLEHPERIDEAWAEYHELVGDGYQPLIPKDVIPTPLAALKK